MVIAQSVCIKARDCSSQPQVPTILLTFLTLLSFSPKKTSHSGSAMGAGEGKRVKESRDGKREKENESVLSTSVRPAGDITHVDA